MLVSKDKIYSFQVFAMQSLVLECPKLVPPTSIVTSQLENYVLLSLAGICYWSI